MNFYLKKYGFRNPINNQLPKTDLNIIIVIPCHNEPDIISSLNSLNNCTVSNGSIEVIIVVNSSEINEDKIKKQNLSTIQEINDWLKLKDSLLDIQIIHEPDMPKKHAGVGLARKIGMDEAVHRFDLLNKDGIIACFDADSLCESNYLIELEYFFENNPKSPGCSIKYAHPIDGNDFNDDIYAGIINYELFLRYYNVGLIYANLPFAFHTVGSSMAVRSSVYQKQGGMNKRKAGEDFYFLHKIISLGNFKELNSTSVIPSPRTSDRVPFGTGKAINDWIENQSKYYLTYDFRIWELLKKFRNIIPQLQELEINETEFSKQPDNLHFIEFLNLNNFKNDLIEIRSNSTNADSFIKRFFVWFNAFRVLKLVHYLRDEQYPNTMIFDEAKKLSQLFYFGTESANTKELLIEFRKFENK